MIERCSSLDGLSFWGSKVSHFRGAIQLVGALLSTSLWYHHLGCLAFILPRWPHLRVDFLWTSCPLDFWGPPLFEPSRWSSPPLLPLDFPGTCMSQPPAPDSEVVDLSLSFGGLSLSIRGSPDRAAAFVRDLASSHSSGYSPSGFGSPSGIGSGISLPSSASYSVVPSLPVRQPTVAESRSSIRESFPPVPLRWLDFVVDLRDSRLTGEQRIERAWTAGCWAGAVKNQRIGTPDRTTSIKLSNRFYVVIRCKDLACPRVFTSHRSFHRAVGVLAGTNTICHGFPTEREARIFLEAAGEDYPLQLD